MKHVTIIVAMEQEAAPLIDDLRLTAVPMHDPCLPCRAYRGLYENLELTLVINGKDPIHDVQNIGTQPATLTALEAIRFSKPDLIINAGTCGAFASKGSDIGTVYIGERIRFFDRRVFMKNYTAYGEGHYGAPEAIALARALNLPTAVVCTGSSMDMTATDEAILQKEPVVTKEMEAASIAWVASFYKIPVVAMKSVTNLVDTPSDTVEAFHANLNFASQQLKAKMLDLLVLLNDRVVLLT
ncbi:hypothetical protein [Candidatus Sororendozoicomonas aggregata]|uniref:phosphorylase family protein n=1 Tax=Candidatus Sororendozoicomonas aggregata TaxID=3073239 RepID=UPI002ED62DBE